MPIVNGTYVPTSFGSDQVNIQKQAFGPDWKPTSRDMSDYSQAAYNYIMKQQEQAYNLDLWNLYNEYWTSDAQMQRYQDAGLNPNLIYGQAASPTQSPASSSAASFRSSGNFAKSIQNGIGVVSQILNTVKAARETYDYLSYGAETNRWNMIRSQESALGLKLDNEWNDYLLHGDDMIYGDSSRIPNGPRARAFDQSIRKTQNQGIQAYWAAERLKGLVGMIDDEKLRLQIENDIKQYQYQIMQGQNDAILNIDTGFSGLDSFLKAIFFFISNFSVGFSHKF